MSYQDDHLMTEWALSNARVVGLFKEGEALVEHCDRLFISEGRVWSAAYSDGGDLKEESLDYSFFFQSTEAAPDHGHGLEAKIDITGEDPAGRRVNISGRGYVGYDETGQLQGSFYQPPTIKVILGEERSARIKREVAEYAAEHPISYDA